MNGETCDQIIRSVCGCGDHKHAPTGKIQYCLVCSCLRFRIKHHILCGEPADILVIPGGRVIACPEHMALRSQIVSLFYQVQR